MGEKRALTATELERLIQTIDLSSPVSIRNATLIMVMIHTGAKTSELVGRETDDGSSAHTPGLLLEDVDLKQHQIRLRGRRGENERWKPLPLVAEQFLRTWLTIRTGDTDAVFVTMRGTRLQNRYVRRMLHQYGKQAGIEVDVKPSVLRRTYAARVLNETGSLTALQSALGQRHLASAARYLNEWNRGQDGNRDG